MSQEMKLRSVTDMGDGVLHVKLEADIPDNDVSHSVVATVVLEYSGDITSYTLGRIQTDARNRLALDERSLR